MKAVNSSEIKEKSKTKIAHNYHYHSIWPDDSVPGADAVPGQKIRNPEQQRRVSGVSTASVFRLLCPDAAVSAERSLYRLLRFHRRFHGGYPALPESEAHPDSHCHGGYHPSGIRSVHPVPEGKAAHRTAVLKGGQTNA